MIKKSLVACLFFVFLALYAPQRSISEEQKNTATLLATYTTKQQTESISFLDLILKYSATKKVASSALVQLHQQLLHNDEINLSLATSAFAELDAIAQTINPTNPIHAQELQELELQHQ